jgi:hypothetical protein
MRDSEEPSTENPAVVALTCGQENLETLKRDRRTWEVKMSTKAFCDGCGKDLGYAPFDCFPDAISPVRYVLKRGDRWQKGDRKWAVRLAETSRLLVCCSPECVVRVDEKTGHVRDEAKNVAIANNFSEVGRFWV